MEYRVSGKYGLTYIRIEDNKAKVEAVVRGKNYRIETDDVKYAIQQFSRFVGSIGLVASPPEMLMIEITRNGKAIVHLCKIFAFNGREHIVPYRTITPHGIERDTYTPVVGVVKKYFIRLSQ